jgi:hypothetical protein
MVRPAGYAPASQHWQCRILLVDHGREKREGSAGPGQIPMPRRSHYKNVRPHGQPATHQVAAIRRTAIHNKERTPLRALVFSYPQVFHGGCFGVSGTPPLRLFIYIFI